MPLPTNAKELIAYARNECDSSRVVQRFIEMNSNDVADWFTSAEQIMELAEADELCTEELVLHQPEKVVNLFTSVAQVISLNNSRTFSFFKRLIFTDSAKIANLFTTADEVIELINRDKLFSTSGYSLVVRESQKFVRLFTTVDEFIKLVHVRELNEVGHGNKLANLLIQLYPEKIVELIRGAEDLLALRKAFKDREFDNTRLLDPYLRRAGKASACPQESGVETGNSAVLFSHGVRKSNPFHAPLNEASESSVCINSRPGRYSLFASSGSVSERLLQPSGDSWFFRM